MTEVSHDKQANIFIYYKNILNNINISQDLRPEPHSWKANLNHQENHAPSKKLHSTLLIEKNKLYL